MDSKTEEALAEATGIEEGGRPGQLEVDESPPLRAPPRHPPVPLVASIVRCRREVRLREYHHACRLPHRQPRPLHWKHLRPAPPSLSLSLSLVHICMIGCSNLNSRSPKFEKCPAILQGRSRTLCLAKVNNSAKGKVLLRAFNAVKVETIFVCSIIVEALSGCSKPLIDLHVSESFLWSEVFNDLQADVNEKIRGMLSCEKVVLLKELEAVDTCAKKLYVLSSIVDDLEDITRHGDNANHEEAMTLEKTVSQEERERWQKSVSDLVDIVKKLANGIDLISEQSRGFLKVVLTGRGTLLCKLRESDVTQEDKVHKSRK